MTQKALVIVESPAKAKTINKYLGKDYLVKSCVGHIRDLPVGANKTTPTFTPPKEVRSMTPEEKQAWYKEKKYLQLVANMGIDPENHWQAQYAILPGKEKVVKELKKFAKNADKIYLATDLDREGEAIAWHLREILGGEDDLYQRVVFNEITKSAISKAFEKPAHINMPRVYAQQTRRFLDRVVGFMLSPLLWAKVARGLSAGRVQSVAVRLVVEKEQLIRAFNPEEYWEIYADLTPEQQQDIRFQIVKEAGKSFRPNNEAQTQTAVDKLKNAQYQVKSREEKASQSRPNPPFITSTLQQAASTRLNFGVKKTMTMAQRLYEAGYITYMRTDATALSQEAIAQCRDYIGKKLGAKYLPEKPQVYSSKASAQEAHEAIRPTSVTREAKGLEGMEQDAKKLYDLIWRQFVACQMPAAKFNNTILTVQAGDFELRAKGRVILFDGFMKVLSVVSKNDQDVILPEVKENQNLALKKLDPSQHFTKPPSRFNEASLVKELEKRGIGRPSTYASIISTIQDRGYVRTESRRFYAEKMGEIVTDRLTNSFDNLMSYDFTARMEEQLDNIAEKKSHWENVLNDFYQEFKNKLDSAYEQMSASKSVTTELKCRLCQNPLEIRHASTGTFLGCSTFRETKCKGTINLIADHHVLSNEDEEAQSLHNKKRCQICEVAMEGFIIDETQKIHVCGNSPQCVGYELEAGTFKLHSADTPTIECDKCGKDMELRVGRFGKYFACTGEECKNTRKVLKSGEAAPPKMDPIPMPDLRCKKVDDHYILRDGASGLFLAASKFPKLRETRAPKVEELLPVKDKLDPKYHYLLTAPTADKEGNHTEVRFSRKNKQPFIASVKDGKLTGWSLFYNNNQWQEVKKK